MGTIQNGVSYDEKVHSTSVHDIAEVKLKMSREGLICSHDRMALVVDGDEVRDTVERLLPSFWSARLF